MDRRKALGERIRELRKLKGYSQEKLAEMVGIEPPSICYIERGRNYPAFQNLEKIADTLGVTFSDIFTFDKPMETDDFIFEINRILKENPGKIKDFYKIIKALVE